MPDAQFEALPMIKAMTADETAKRELLSAIADHGMAAGMEASAKVILEVVKTSTRVVGTNMLRTVADALEEKAKTLRANADVTITSLGVEYAYDR